MKKVKELSTHLKKKVFVIVNIFLPAATLFQTFKKQVLFTIQCFPALPLKNSD